MAEAVTYKDLAATRQIEAGGIFQQNIRPTSDGI
jgi:hypothetical protein